MLGIPLPFVAHRRRGAALALVAAAALVALVACGDGTGPVDDGSTPIRANEAIVGSVGGATPTVRLRYDAPPSQPFELFFRADGDRVGLYRIFERGDTIPVALPAAGDTTTHRIRNAGDVDGSSFVLLVMVAPGGAGGAYRLLVAPQNPLPESRPATIALDEMIEERLDSPIDADRYEFTITEETRVRAFLQYRDPASADVRLTAFIRRMDVRPPLIVAIVDAAGIDDAFMALPSEQVVLRPGHYDFVVVRQTLFDGPDETPRYRAQLHRPNAAPEERPARVAVGDSVYSVLDYQGDRDEWELVGTPGASTVAFAQAIDGTHVSLHSIDPTVSFAPVVAVRGLALFRGPSAAFVMPPSGVLRIAVDADVQGYSGPSRGAYRFFAYHPDTLPEGRALDLAPGELASGTITAPGDADVYRVTLAAPAVVNLALTRPAVNGSDAFTAALRRDGSAVVTTRVPDPEAFASSLARGSGPVLVEAGTYWLRVGAAATSPGAYVGAYTVRLSPIDSQPETRAATIAYGDTVRGEAIDVAGDVDVFTFAASAGDTVAARVAGDPNAGPVHLRITTAAGIALSSYPITSNGVAETGLVALPAAGAYRVRVAGLHEGRVLDQVGPYRLELYRRSRMPEGRAAALPIGETLSAERLEHAGDVDVFEVEAPAGREAMFTLTAMSDRDALTFALRVVDPATGAALSTAYTSNGWTQASDRVAVPASGRLRVVVEQDSVACSGCHWPVLAGTYRLSSYYIDRAPETRGAAIAIGEAVQEAVSPDGDVDEYRFDAVAGERLLIELAVNQAGGCVTGLRASVLAGDGGGATLAWNSNTFPPPVEARAFTASATGRYLLRVDGVHSRCGSGTYTVRLVRE